MIKGMFIKSQKDKSTKYLTKMSSNSQRSEN